MLAKFCWGSFGMTATFAALALASAGLDAQTDSYSGLLEALTLAFISGALLSLALFVLLGLALIGSLIWSHLHAVEVLPGQWDCRYWPAERKAHIGGMGVKIRQLAGNVEIHGECRFTDEAIAKFVTRLNGEGTYHPSFQQESVNFPEDPNEGDQAVVTITAKPAWWRGRSSTLVQTVGVGITDHRRTVLPAQVHEALGRIDELIAEGHSILDSCGRPREQMVGAGPMYFQEQCVPRINKFASDITSRITELCPEYMGKLQNVGNVTHGTDEKPAMIQQVEKWLENLGVIEDELRKRLPGG